MIFGIGTDVIEVNRIEKSLLTIDNFKTRVFTEEEVKYCSKYKNGAQHYAGRYAAKEAMFKAIGTGWCDGMMFTDIEIYNNDLGKPEIRLFGKVKQKADELGISSIFVSITHLKDLANAVVVLEAN